MSTTFILKRDENDVPIQGQDPRVLHAIDIVQDTYNASVSVDDKKKDLLKFGTRTTVGTGWETLMTTVGTGTAETFATTNSIDTIVGASGDTNLIRIEGHTVDGNGATTFVTQTKTLTADTPVSLDTALFRATRAINLSTTDSLGGPVYVYENNSGRDDNKTHLVIPQGEQQTQKAATTISSSDYWFVSGLSISVLSKVTKYAEARLEMKATSSSVWLPISQTLSCTDTTGTIFVPFDPFIVVPANYDVRMAVKTNTSAVAVAGGFRGYLASVQT